MNDPKQNKRQKFHKWLDWLPLEIWGEICSHIADPVDWRSWRETCQAFATVPTRFFHPCIAHSREANDELEIAIMDGQLDQYLSGKFSNLYFNSKKNGALELAIKMMYPDHVIKRILCHPNTRVANREHAAVQCAVRVGRFKLARLMLWWPAHIDRSADLFARNASQPTLHSRKQIAQYNLVRHVHLDTRQTIIAAFKIIRSRVAPLLGQADFDLPWTYAPLVDSIWSLTNAEQRLVLWDVMIMTTREIYAAFSIKFDREEELDLGTAVREASENYIRRRFWEEETSSEIYERMVLDYVRTTFDD